MSAEVRRQVRQLDLVVEGTGLVWHVRPVIQLPECYAPIVSRWMRETLAEPDDDAVVVRCQMEGWWLLPCVAPKVIVFGLMDKESQMRAGLKLERNLLEDLRFVCDMIENLPFFT